MADYTEAFARFILECRDAYGELCERIAGGQVPPGQKATVHITVPSEIIEEIRSDEQARVSNGR